MEKIKNNIFTIFLFILVIVLSYRVFITKKEDATNYSNIIQYIEKEKKDILKAIEKRDENIAQIYWLIKQKDDEIRRRENEISKLKNRLYEKTDSIGSLDNKRTFELLSKWLSESNQK